MPGVAILGQRLTEQTLDKCKKYSFDSGLVDQCYQSAVHAFRSIQGLFFTHLQ